MKKAITIIALIIFIAGLCLFLYAPVTRVVYDTRAHDAVENFRKEKKTIAENTEEKQYLPELYEIMTRRNAELAAGGQAALNSISAYEENEIDLREWGIENKIFAVISLPKINITLPVYLGADDKNMARGAAHMTCTSYPIDTPDSNAVIAAHRGNGGADFFRYIDRLETGDEITVENLWYTMTYKITEIKIVSADDIDEVFIRPGKTMLTLSTCHPYTQNYQRYLVFAEKAEGING